jgi:hypothetical protein
MYGYGFRPNNKMFGGGGGANTLWEGLLAYYTADNTPNDALGTYNGTLTNGATYAVGKINNGFSFDGVNDYVSISPTFGSSFSAPASAHSYSAWIYITGYMGNNVIIQNGNSGMGTMFMIYAGYLAVSYRGGNVLIQTTTTLPYNTWNHVSVTYNGAGTFIFYLNGVAINTFTGRTWIDGTGTCTTQIGSYNRTLSFFNGKIDELSAWNRELTSTEVTELYNSGSGLQYS